MLVFGAITCCNLLNPAIMSWRRPFGAVLVCSLTVILSLVDILSALGVFIGALANPLGSSISSLILFFVRSRGIRSGSDLHLVLSLGSLLWWSGTGLRPRGSRG